MVDVVVYFRGEAVLEHVPEGSIFEVIAETTGACAESIYKSDGVSSGCLRRSPRRLSSFMMKYLVAYLLMMWSMM